MDNEIGFDENRFAPPPLSLAQRLLRCNGGAFDGSDWISQHHSIRAQLPSITVETSGTQWPTLKLGWLLCLQLLSSIVLFHKHTIIKDIIIPEGSFGISIYPEQCIYSSVSVKLWITMGPLPPRTEMSIRCLIFSLYNFVAILFQGTFLLTSTLFDFQFTSLDNVQLEYVLSPVHLIVPLIRHQRTIWSLQSHFPYSSTSSSIPPLLSRRTLLSEYGWVGLLSVRKKRGEINFGELIAFSYPFRH